MKIREFSELDSESLYKLLEEFLSYTRKTYTSDVLEFDDFDDSRKDAYIKSILDNFCSMKNSKFFVAEKDSEVLGYIIGYSSMMIILC